MVGVMGTGIGIEIGRKLSILLNIHTEKRQLTQSLLSVLHLTISPCRSEKASRFTPWLVWLKGSITYLHFIWTLFIGINSLFGLVASVQTSPFRLHMDLNFAMMDPFSNILSCLAFVPLRKFNNFSHLFNFAKHFVVLGDEVTHCLYCNRS